MSGVLARKQPIIYRLLFLFVNIKTNNYISARIELYSISPGCTQAGSQQAVPNQNNFSLNTFLKWQITQQAF